MALATKKNLNLEKALAFIEAAPDAKRPEPAPASAQEVATEVVPTLAPEAKPEAPKKPRNQGKIGNRFVRGNKEYISMAFVPGTLDRIDDAAKKMGLSRTAWLTVVIGQVLDGR